MSDNLITIPVAASYRVIDGKPVMVSAEYWEVSADDVARFLLEKFNVPFEKQGGEDD